MKWLVVLLGVIGLGYAGCTVAYPSVTLRYRLTVEVDTPEGPKTGSSVIKVRYASGPGFMSNYSSTMSVDVKGEAVALDLGKRGVLFATLREGARGNGAVTRIIPEAFGMPGSGPRDRIVWLRANIDTGDKRSLTPDQLPLLVRFRDINDPKSVEAVDPDKLAESFGPGVRLKRVTIAITDDPVTTGIEKRLGWLIGLQTQLDGSRYNDSTALSNNLNVLDFKRRELNNEP